MRKRSSSATLVLMSTVPFFLSACSQSEPTPAPKPAPKPTTAYETVADCTFDGRPRDVCETALANAKNEAAKTAPRFKTLEECEKEFDNCAVAPAVAAAAPVAGAPTTTVVHAGGGDSFSPMLMGFMVGQALGGGGSSSGAYAAGFNNGAASERDRNYSGGGSAGASSALYRSRGGQLSQVSTASDGRAAATPVRARTMTSAQVSQIKTAQAKAAQARATQARASASTRSVSRSGFGGRSGGFGG